MPVVTQRATKVFLWTVEMAFVGVLAARLIPGQTAKGTTRIGLRQGCLAHKAERLNTMIYGPETTLKVTEVAV